jgi:hypothetical protein
MLHLLSLAKLLGKGIRALELDKYSFSCLNALSHSSDHSKAFCKTLKKGKHLSIDLEMNLFVAAIFPINYCNWFVFFGDCISKTA